MKTAAARDNHTSTATPALLILFVALPHPDCRATDHRLPTVKGDRQAYAEQIGADGHALLDAIYAGDAEAWLRHIPAVETMRRVWVQQFYRSEARV